ncbi:MAG: single-stranded DNA-binding protein [Hyphomicrobiales bacterium]|nr:single-stranded DNA-binding protein [Hyphomicrobiales bacterium]
MRSTNLVIIRGHVGADAKGFDKGSVAKISVATNRIWTDRQTGEKKEATDWVTLTVLNEKTAKWAIGNVKKGDAVYAEGRIADNRYQQGGETKYSTDIIVNVLDRLAPRASDDE